MKKKIEQHSLVRTRWWWAVLGVLGVVVVGAGAFWLLSEGTDASVGSPRLAVDRELVDLGDLPFPARAVFTLTNSGDGVLRLAEVPRVRAVKGC